MTTTPNTNLSDLPEKFRHPNVEEFHLTKISDAHWQSTFQIIPFTGTEPRPRHPDELFTLFEIEFPVSGAVNQLYNTLLGQWSNAKFALDIAEPLKHADTAWKTWKRAESAMNAAYAAFDDIANDMWSSTRLRLNDAHDDALTAARNFDDHARDLAELENIQWDDMRKSMGETNGEEHYASIRESAHELGIDTSDWIMDWIHAYTRSYSDTPLVYQTKQAISTHNDRLNRVQDTHHG